MSVRGLLSRASLIVVCLFFVFSCQTMSGTGKSAGVPSATTPKTVKKRPTIALVLGGGSAKGFAHVGVLRVLEQEKIPIDMIIGTSVGSLIGGLYAANPDSFQLEWTAFKIERSDILDFSIVYSKLGPVQGARLENFVEQHVSARRIEDTKIPFCPIATDLNTGETVTLEKGSLAKAIRASTAIPGIFVPVTFGNRTLVDGGVTDNVACDVAKARGADIIIAVNLQKDIKNYEIGSLVDIIAQSVNIMMRESSREKIKAADVLIEPDTRGVSLFDFTQKKVLMEAGIQATRQAMPRIRALMQRYQQ
ncbi:MAG: patatin-like phospholipase family protein [Syntrophorhabdales bacterium]|jgi:NTE family protein